MRPTASRGPAPTMNPQPRTQREPEGPARHGSPPPAAVRAHCTSLQSALERMCRDSTGLLERWAGELARALPAGARLLAAGNGGSAAQAQHLTAELVGRYRRERPPFSAIALHAESSSVTAIGNDYGYDHVFARQVAAHGRPGDVALFLSTSGRSGNLLSAAAAAREHGLRAWALTGPAPNPLAGACDEALCIDADTTATVQEVHLVAVHLLCEALDEALDRDTAATPRPPGTGRAATRVGTTTTARPAAGAPDGRPVPAVPVTGRTP
ncbi:SIS domain-containing protein [Streptomyces sp. CS62]